MFPGKIPELETPEARDRRLGKMTREQKRGVALFVVVWIAFVAVALMIPGAAVAGLLLLVVR